MKNVLKVDSAHSRLIMDRSFAKKAATVGSDEYTMLQTARRDYPSYTVVRREIKRNTGKESYRGLTYEYMEAYIDAHENAAARRKEFDELKLLAQCHSIRFPAIKAWFLRTYTEVKDFGKKPKSDEDPLPVAA